MQRLISLKNYRFFIYGFFGGLGFLFLGIWLEANRHRLPFTLWAFLYLHRTSPMIIMLDLAPLVFAAMIGLIGLQWNLQSIIAKGKREWEITFDASLDPIFVIDERSQILRCNRAVIDRLKTTFTNVIGRRLYDVLDAGQSMESLQSSTHESELLWLGRVYDIAISRINVEDASERTLFILHDVTERKKAETALEENETLFRALFELSPEAVVLIDPHDASGTWPIIDCNQVACRMNGYSREELIGHSVDLLNIAPGTQAERMDYFDQLKEKGYLKLETYHRHKDGRIFPVEVSTSVMTIGNRELILGLDRDITERRQVEEALAKEQYLLHALLDAAPDYIYFKDTESRFIRTSKAHAKAFGLSDPALVIGKADLDFFSGEHARQAYEDEQEIIRTGQPISKEEKETWEDRPDTWVLTTKMPLCDQQGNIIGTFGISKDISESKQVQAELTREKQFFESLVFNSPAAIVVLDDHERIISCNPAFEELYRYHRDEVIGVALDTLITTPETLAEAQQYSQKVMHGTVHGFVRRRRKDHSLVDVELFGVPVFVAGEKIGTLAIYHDISELVRARKEAEEASRTKSEFLANMSHEIRTPMNGVMGMLELALDTSLTSEQRDYLQTSLHSAEALLTLLNDILDFSKIEAGRLELETINFNLRNAVEDVAYTLARRAQDKGLEMACLIHPDLTSDLRGDPGRIRQVLVNLVGNAIKFTHQGEIVIHAEAVEETATHATIHVAVQDSGIGIPYERQAAIFDRFTQADGSTTRKYGGTGLGLTISKQLVEAMGGRIGLESTPGSGSTFWFEIRVEKQIRKKPTTAPLTLHPVNLSQARVLIVDDNQTNRLVLTKNIEALGSRAEAVSSGAKALEALRNAHRAGDSYHVILLDMQMPGMDGEQTARAIKSDPSARDAKIIVLTSMGERGDAGRFEALGCSGYLLKPVKQQMLFEAVIAVLSREEDSNAQLVTRHMLSEQRKTGQRILLAEDNSINQKLAVVLLQKAGYSVDAVETGLQALEKVKANRYSAVLMDIQMPDMDGLEATQKIRELERETGQHISIIAMTAHAMQGDRERCLEAGMDDYVTKPLQPKVLFSALERWIPADDSVRENSEPAQDYSSQEQGFAMDLDDGLFGEETPAVPQERKIAAPVFETAFATDALPVDFEDALVHFDGDREFMWELLKQYQDQLPERLAEIRAAIQAGDASLLARLGHTLKGVSLNFSATSLATLSLALEELGKREDLRDAPLVLRQLEAEVARVAEYLAVSGL